MANKSVHPKIIRLGEKVAEWYIGNAEDAKAYIEKIEGERLSDNLFVCRVYLKDGRILFIGPTLMVLDSRTSRVIVETYRDHQCINTTAIGPSLLPDHDFTDVFNNNEETKQMITLNVDGIKVDLQELRDTTTTFKRAMVVALGLLDGLRSVGTSGITTTEFGIDGDRVIVHYKGNRAFAWIYSDMKDAESLDILARSLADLGPKVKEQLSTIGNPVDHIELAVLTDNIKDYIVTAANCICKAITDVSEDIPGMHLCK